MDNRPGSMEVPVVHCVFACLRGTRSVKLWGESSHNSRLHGWEKEQKIAVFMKQTRLHSTKLACGNLINCGSLLSLQGFGAFVNKEAFYVFSMVIALCKHMEREGLWKWKHMKIYATYTKIILKEIPQGAKLSISESRNTRIRVTYGPSIWFL